MKLVDTLVMKELTPCVWCVQKSAPHYVTSEVGGYLGNERGPVCGVYRRLPLTV